jgi:hypothetical protein
MGDKRRELYLSGEIDRLQDEKIKALVDSKTLHGAEKASVIDHFLDLDKKQKVLEVEFERLQEDL